MNIILPAIGGGGFDIYPLTALLSRCGNADIIVGMTASALAVSPGTPGRIRSLNPMRDLSAVADLVELCFKSTMDRDGRRYLQDMRRSATDSAFLRWASKTSDSISLPLNGYVWEDNGRIIGNVSLIPYNRRNKHVYLIANVATHPDFRRRGIGRMLTDSAMKHARDKHADEIWLHVREDNPGAITLYEDLGFRERYRRTTYNSSSSAPIIQAPQGTQIRPRRTVDWAEQSAWLERLHPQGISWYYSNFWNVLKPGMMNSLGNFLADVNVDHWTAWRAGELHSTASVIYGRDRVDIIWVAAAPDGTDEALHAMLVRIRSSIDSRRGLLLEYPAHQSEDAIRAAGFALHRTLLWMKAE
jgi:ribosomal protein S18 acetylase RimI-like enzyme